jgi:hypothetical protein
MFYIPMKLSFNLNKHQTSADIAFDELPSWVNSFNKLFKIFVIDIFLKFNTAFY